MRAMQKVRCKGFSMCGPVGSRGYANEKPPRSFFSSSQKLFFLWLKFWHSFGKSLCFFPLPWGLLFQCFLVSRSSRDKLVGRLHYRRFFSRKFAKALAKYGLLLTARWLGRRRAVGL